MTHGVPQVCRDPSTCAHKPILNCICLRKGGCHGKDPWGKKAPVARAGWVQDIKVKTKDTLHWNDPVILNIPPVDIREMRIWSHELGWCVNFLHFLTRRKSLVRCFLCYLTLNYFKQRLYCLFGQPASMCQEKGTSLYVYSVSCHAILSFVFLLWSLQR